MFDLLRYGGARKIIIQNKNGLYIGNASNPYMIFVDVENVSLLTGSSITVHEDTKIIMDSTFADAENYQVNLGNKLTFFNINSFHGDGLYINYSGTIAEWNEISKSNYMFMGTGYGGYNIMCTDGSPEHD